MKTLVLGLGNPILTDDGIGFVLVDMLKDVVSNQEVSFEKISLAGMEVLEIMLGYDKVILLDAIQLGGEPGEVHLLNESDLHLAQHSATHDLSFKSILAIGRQYFAERMPEQLIIFGIEAKDIVTFSENLSPELSSKLPEMIRKILLEIN